MPNENILKTIVDNCTLNKAPLMHRRHSPKKLINGPDRLVVRQSEKPPANITRTLSVPPTALPSEPFASTSQFEDTSSTILDIAAHPTHFPKPRPTMNKTRNPIYTTTATNHKHPITHSVPILIPSPIGELEFPSVVEPHIPDTLVSVRSMTGKHRAIIFFEDHQYIMPTSQLPEVYRPFQTATWVYNAYKLDDVSNRAKHAPNTR